MNPATLKVSLAALLLAAWLPASAAESGIRVKEGNQQVRVEWPVSAGETGVVVFNMDATQPLIESIGLAAKGQPEVAVATKLNPLTLLTVGERDLSQAGWMAFFDSPYKRPYETHRVELGARKLQVSEGSTRTTLSVAAVSAGGFRGDLRFTFYRNSPLIHSETVVSTQQDSRAIIYDTGLTSAAPTWASYVWKDQTGQVQRAKPDDNKEAEPLKVAGRTVVAESASGSLAVLPSPHQYFYPLDEVINLGFAWQGRGYGKLTEETGFGIRLPLMGDRRHVPWFNAPPGTEQRLGVFYLVSRGPADKAFESVAALTRGDRFKKLPGYFTFTSHYHFEHTRKFLKEQKAQKVDGIPAGLEKPPFVETFKARGVNIVHTAEFHYAEAASAPDDVRLNLLKTMHAEFERLSDDELLVLPGEEPNVHLGGHWMSLFPKPVYWTHERSKDQPLVEKLEPFGTVYHVGSPEDVLELMEKENGLMWTAHPRIKGSKNFPDKYKDEPFYRSAYFLGAAWKAMPGDLSLPRLGTRSLDLLDDMSNWGDRKHVVGEVDAFSMEPIHESYGHMNINYLRLDKLPRFKDGWQPVLDALRAGQFFTTTGEVLIPEWTVGGKSGGQQLPGAGAEPLMLEAQLEWTFPLAYAEVVSGDGKEVFRQRIELTDTEAFGTRKLKVPVVLQGRKWVRFEVWDIATNGAFTQPVWIGAPEPRPLPAEPEKKANKADEKEEKKQPDKNARQDAEATKAGQPVSQAPAPGGADAAPRTYARFVPERADDFAWENDLIAFRVYGPAIRGNKKPKPGDEDSGIDVWCKRVPYPVIDRWYAAERAGQSYHADHGEGMDSYSVGGSRGCGGTAIWKDGKMVVSGPFKSWKIISSEPARTVFELTYQYDLGDEKIQEVKRISIAMGERLFRSESTFTKDGKPAALDVAIGVTTHGNKGTTTLNQSAGWMAVWEKSAGGLGTGVVIDPARILSMREDKPADGDSHALIITRTDANGKTTHWAGYGWATAGTITNTDLWQQYLATFAKNSAGR